jgi:hypothetical protein
MKIHTILFNEKERLKFVNHINWETTFASQPISTRTKSQWTFDLQGSLGASRACNNDAGDSTTSFATHHPHLTVGNVALPLTRSSTASAVCHTTPSSSVSERILLANKACALSVCFLLGYSVYCVCWCLTTSPQLVWWPCARCWVVAGE